MVLLLQTVLTLPVLLGAAELASCDLEDSPECSSVPGRALLQHKRAELKPSREVGEEQVRATAKTLRSKPDVPPPDAAVQDVHFKMSTDGQHAKVSFSHQGRHFQHHLAAHSVFAPDAVLLRHTSQGEVPIPLGEPSTFASREPGRWATVSLQEGGLITGLFEMDGHIVRVQPTNTSLSSGARTHLVHTLPPPDTTHLENLSALQLQANTTAGASKPKVAVDNDPTGHFGHDVSPDEEQMLSARATLEMETQSASWNGRTWKGSCYPGDIRLHKFSLNILADQDFYNDHGSRTRSKLESAVAEASFIFEKQMNIRLEIGYLKIYESGYNAPSYATGCPGGDFMSTKLDQLTANPPSGFQGATHLFTGCGNGWGTVGLAYMGTICQHYNTGVNQFTAGSGWLTFAHELGHNMGADHSFEQGQGSTGGIMDYGDGKLNGEYQFNTQYRKTEVCDVLSRVGSCRGKFVEIAGAPSPPSPPAYTPSPTPSPTQCRDNSRYKDAHGFKCEHWVGHNCRTYESWWYGYSDAELRSVMENCPVSCRLCGR